MDLPDDLQDLWRTRLDALCEEEPRAPELLELAATFGLEVDEDEWLEAAQRASLPLTARALAELVRHRLVEREGERWRLAHTLLREILLRVASEHDRLRGWHHHAASVLQARGTPSPERLGRHLVAAGQVAEAIAPLFAAAAKRRELGDYAEALNLLDARDQALESLPTPDLERARSQVLRARIAGHRTEFDAVVALCEPVLADARAHSWSGLLPEAMRTLAFAWWQQGRYDEAEGLYRDALPLFEALPEAEGVGRCQLGLGIAAYQRSDFEQALRYAKTAHAVFEAAGITRGCVDALGWTAILERRRGRADESRRLLERAVATADASGLRFGAAMIRNTLGVALRSEGRLDEARVLFRQVLQETELLGSGEAVWPRINLGLLALERRHVRSARKHLGKALELLETMGRVTFSGGVQVALVACAGLEGDRHAWDEHAAAAATALELAPMPHEDIAASAALAARAARKAGQFARAGAMYGLARAQLAALGEDTAELESEFAGLA